MMAANYRHIGGGGNRLGRHYNRFSRIWLTTFLADQSLALRKSQNAGSNRRSRVSVGKLGRLRDGKVAEFRLPRAGSRPFGAAVDTAHNVWYTDLSGRLGLLPARAAKAP